MPPKAEYWTLTADEFKEIKFRIERISEKILEELIKNGFTKIKSSTDWLGATIEKKDNNTLTFVAFSLYREDPREFLLSLSWWKFAGKVVDQSSVLYEKQFSSIAELETHFNEEIKAIKSYLPM